MKKYKVIENDLFGIAKQITKINRNFYLVYNKSKKCFEVHNKKFKNKPFEFSVPCKQLSKKVIVNLLKNLNKSNLQKIQEIEKHNKKIEQDVYSKELNERNYKLQEIFDYANSGAKEYDYTKSYKNVWF